MLCVPVRWGGEVRFVGVLISARAARLRRRTRSSSPRRSPTRPPSRSPCSSPSAAAPPRRAGRRADPRRGRPQRVARARRGARDAERARPTSPWAARWPASTSPTARAAASRRRATSHAGGLEGDRDDAAARASPGACWTTGRAVRHQRLPGRGRASAAPRRCGGSGPPSACRWRGTASSRARSRSASPRCGGSPTRTCARSRRSPPSRSPPAATPRPTSTPAVAADHRRPHRAAQPRRAAPARPRGDLPLRAAPATR